jgi:hypothetical protein
VNDGRGNDTGRGRENEVGRPVAYAGAEEVSHVAAAEAEREQTPSKDPERVFSDGNGKADKSKASRDAIDQPAGETDQDCNVAALFRAGRERCFEPMQEHDRILDPHDRERKRFYSVQAETETLLRCDGDFAPVIRFTKPDGHRHTVVREPPMTRAASCGLGLDIAWIAPSLFSGAGHRDRCPCPGAVDEVR